jgi:signal transduction histidine kinase
MSLTDDIDESILEMIYSSVLKLLTQLSPEEIYSTVVNEAIKLVKGDDGAILLVQNGEFKKVYSSSASIAAVKTRKNGFSYRAFTKNKAFMIDYYELRKAHPEKEFENVHSSLFIPLAYKKKALGTLIVRSSRKDRSFDNKELHVLQLFGSMATLAITQAEFYSQLQQALNMRDKFISMAAHELRTPLTAIHGYSQLLSKRLGGSESSESRWADQLTYECNRMRILIDDLLEINRIKSGKTNYVWKECNLSEILNRAKNNFKFMYPDRSISVSNELENKDPFVVGDFDKLLQAILNLLDNAGKFSSNDYPVMLSLDNKDTYYRIRVRDKGLGIKENDINQVKSSYFVGSNHNKEGMGLGLYLVEDIVSAHRGFVSIKSKEGKGTTVELLLPIHVYDKS